MALIEYRKKNESLFQKSQEANASLNTVIDMLKTALETDDSEKTRNCLNIANSASQQLFTFLNDIIDMSKIEKKTT
jgi:signal transduction histidine kinase